MLQPERARAERGVGIRGHREAGLVRGLWRPSGGARVGRQMHAGAAAVQTQAHRKGAGAFAVVGDQGSVRRLQAGEDDGFFGLPKVFGDVPVSTHVLDRRHGDQK